MGSATARRGRDGSVQGGSRCRREERGMWFADRTGGRVVQCWVALHRCGIEPVQSGLPVDIAPETDARWREAISDQGNVRTP